jgi:lipopolysaccharide transport system ATP-binding protein
MTIILSNVDKVFRISHERGDTLFSKFNTMLNKIKYENFYALKDISLNIEKGECIGIVGENGSGKSTLLKIISRILVPTKGKVTTNGRIVPLIELGVGLQDDLTAKENIFLYGAIMGLKRNEIKEKFNKIINFSELKKFIDTKLRSFSSGMRVRLAFSIAIETNPEILLLDEIFAVGDREFQERSLEVLNNFKNQGKTILLASHNLKSIKGFCEKTILLYKGRLIKFDKTNVVLKNKLLR